MAKTAEQKPESLDEVTIRLLSKAPKKAMQFPDLGRKWCANHLVCLGVETYELLEDLILRGIVSYDQDTDRVSLAPEEDRKKIAGAVYLKLLENGDISKNTRERLHFWASNGLKKLYDSIETVFEKCGSDALQGLVKYTPKPYSFRPPAHY